MRDGERGDYSQQRTEAAERDHQAKEEQQVVGAVQDVLESQLDETRRRLLPSWIERHRARIRRQLIGAHGSSGRQESHHREYSRGQVLKMRIDSEARPVRSDRVVEEHVKPDLVPEDMSAIRK